MARISLGSSNTDSNGVASKTYSATGLGKVEFIAVYSNLVSNPIEVIDAQWYDKGITGNANSNYYISGSNTSRTVTSTGTLVKNTSSSTRYYCAVLPNTTVSSITDTKCFSGDIGFEIDIESFTGGSIQVYGDSNRSRNLSAYDKNSFTARFKVEDGVAYRYSDLGNWVSMDSVGSAYGIRLGIPTNTEIKFKEWRIYSL